MIIARQETAGEQKSSNIGFQMHAKLVILCNSQLLFSFSEIRQANGYYYVYEERVTEKA